MSTNWVSLLMGHQRGLYWYGSRLSILEARRLVPHNNATSLQVTAAVLAGVIWAMENPSRGIVEPDELDHVRTLQIARPYLGEVVGAYSDWTPLQDRGRLFEESVDLERSLAVREFPGRVVLVGNRNGSRSAQGRPGVARPNRSALLWSRFVFCVTTRPYSRLVDAFYRKSTTRSSVRFTERENRAGLRLCLSMNGAKGKSLARPRLGKAGNM